ncbi:DUF3696 domain-containing protein [Acinetobacter sp.]|uniref:DUF3696 domain-containing protein n=1 Tax=Acinetobacter sp. TaxID=472 RepID=UPI002FC86103
MLKQIGIENFKAFAEFQEINLAPITLIYGANSSGKSSIIHALMVLKQSTLFSNLKSGIYSDKKILDVGSYSTMVYSHDIQKDIKFSLNFNIRGTRSSNLERLATSFVYSFDDNDKQGFSYLKNIKFEDKNRRDSFGYTFKNKFNGKDETSTKNFDLELLENYKLPMRHESLPKPLLKQIMGVYLYDAEEEFSIPKRIGVDGRKHMEVWEKLEKEKYNRVLFEIHNFLNDKIRSNSNFIQKELKKISYLGPLRSNPKRYYSVDSEFEISVGKEGENIAYFLKSDNENLSKSINEWFKNFSIPYEFKPQPIDSKHSEPLIQIELTDLRNNVPVSPLDVGFGIGQILPVLVEGIVRKDSIICVEQPEIHLHPKLQAELAEFFAETCTNNQWIIETHSEALMLRIQKLIRSKKLINGKRLKPEDVSILYVVPSNMDDEQEGAEVVQIRLDDDGDFMDYWPEGFFEERIKERR